MKLLTVSFSPLFKAGRHWIFKHFFEDRETFREIADNYDRDGYRFVLKTPGERNLVQKLLERRGFDILLVENSIGYVVKLSSLFFLHHIL